MNAQEAILQQERLRQYEALSKVEEQVREAIEEIERPWPGYEGNQGPFTGNWRESRDIIRIEIEFSKTKGGGREASAEIENLGISASEFGQAILGMLRRRLETILAEKDKI